MDCSTSGLKSIRMFIDFLVKVFVYVWKLVSHIMIKQKQQNLTFIALYKLSLKCIVRYTWQLYIGERYTKKFSSLKILFCLQL